MSLQHQSHKYYRPILIVTIALSLIAVSAFFSYRHFNIAAHELPNPIKQQLGFSPFVVPSTANKYESESYKLTKPDSGSQLLSYIVTMSSGTNITISQYTQPAEFTDVPEYKDRFLTSIVKQYATIPTSNGTLYLGRQEKQNNKQFAVLIERGLIVLMNPTRDLTNSQWRELGDLLEIEKTTD